MGLITAGPLTLELISVHLAGYVMFVCGRQSVIVCMWTPRRHNLQPGGCYLYVDMCLHVDT